MFLYPSLVVKETSLAPLMPGRRCTDSASLFTFSGDSTETYGSHFPAYEFQVAGLPSEQEQKCQHDAQYIGERLYW